MISWKLFGGSSPFDEALDVLHKFVLEVQVLYMKGYSRHAYVGRE